MWVYGLETEECESRTNIEDLETEECESTMDINGTEYDVD